MKVIECPRDAMQGIKQFIPTKEKIQYLNQLLKVGFDTLDFGSFVSPKAIPQMGDTAEVLKGLDLEKTKTKLLAIIANLRGANDASHYPEITYLGFPFSVSETFQKRNANQSIGEALEVVAQIQDICSKNNKNFVCYLSMGFGNPYGDPYNEEIVSKYIEEISRLGVSIFSLSDTIGTASPESISRLFTQIRKEFAGLEIGVHLHSLPHTAKAKIEAAYNSGCRRIDGALKGYGGCPMAKDELVGNIATETIFEFLEEKNQNINIAHHELQSALELAQQIFSSYS